MSCMVHYVRHRCDDEAGLSGSAIGGGMDVAPPHNQNTFGQAMLIDDAFTVVRHIDKVKESALRRELVDLFGCAHTAGALTGEGNQELENGDSQGEGNQAAGNQTEMRAGSGTTQMISSEGKQTKSDSYDEASFRDGRHDLIVDRSLREVALGHVPHGLADCADPDVERRGLGEVLQDLHATDGAEK